MAAMEASPNLQSWRGGEAPFSQISPGALITASGHTGHLGLRYHAHGDVWLELSMPWREDLVGVPESGVIASGPIISLLDTVTSMAISVRHGAALSVATLDLRIDYMRTARTGATIIARGECYRITRSVAFVRGVAHDGDLDDPVAHAAGSFMRMDTR